MNLNDLLKAFLYLRKKYGHYHVFTRNMMQIIIGEFGQKGVAACQQAIIQSSSDAQEEGDVQVQDRQVPGDVQIQERKNRRRLASPAQKQKQNKNIKI